MYSRLYINVEVVVRCTPSETRGTGLLVSLAGTIVVDVVHYCTCLPLHSESIPPCLALKPRRNRKRFCLAERSTAILHY
jgi:hypothetical protein